MEMPLTFKRFHPPEGPDWAVNDELNDVFGVIHCAENV